MLDKQQVRTQQSDEYIIAVGEDPSSEIQKVVAVYPGPKAFFFVDSNVMKLQAKLVDQITALYEEPLVYKVPAGEASKSVEQWSEMVSFCLSHHPHRNVPVFAIGGGVTGDLAGFVASTVLRGLPLIHIPTTLLAIVDSSIGGKTGINHEAGKNLVGSFYQPKAVIAPLKALQTLSDQEFICGFGEILKYGAIADPDILTILSTKDLSELRENVSLLGSIVQRSIKVKTDVVIRDTQESNLRMILNYGHTFAHAIEKQMGYGKISHGQAVYIGMIAAGILSKELGATIKEELIEQHFGSMMISDIEIDITPDQLLNAMQSDKKRSSTGLRFVVLKQYGRPYVEQIDDTALIEQVWSSTLTRIEELKMQPV
ncbi:MAG: 3-dehydroquinate synthase [Balneolia bacterium]|nr:3-dehydroquinate synthase [Balneolia bacterium]